MEKWEYKFVNSLCELSSFCTCGVTEQNQERQVKVLNEMGNEGWEMCGNVSTKTNAFIFKRKIKSS